VKPHVFHPAASREYTDAAEYYARIQGALGGRFYDEIEGLIQDICRQPERFRLFDAPARRHFSDVFPYVVIYLDEPERVWILAGMHLKRRPGYWRNRL